MGVRAGTGTGRWLCRRRDAEERAMLWPFILIFLKLTLSLLVYCATPSHLLSRRSDKDKKKTTTESKRDKEGEKTQKKYPLILLSGGDGSVNLLTKWLAFN